MCVTIGTGSGQGNKANMGTIEVGTETIHLEDKYKTLSSYKNMQEVASGSHL
jgi:hypothetical protein